MFKRLFSLKNAEKLYVRPVFFSSDCISQTDYHALTLLSFNKAKKYFENGKFVEADKAIKQAISSCKKIDTITPNAFFVELKEFEKELAGRNWDQYALDTGLMVKDGKYKTGAVVKSKNWEYFCNSKKWHALQDLRYIREKAAGKNLESLVEQMPEEDDFHSRIKELL